MFVFLCDPGGYAGFRPAPDPDPGFAGMTTDTVMPDLIRYPDVDEQ
jgi:hypothetical protein